MSMILRLGALGFDSSVLSAFARAHLLELLGRATATFTRRVVVPEVLAELDKGSSEYQNLKDVRLLPWLQEHSTQSIEELQVSYEYQRRLGSSGRNLGESSLLAWAEISGSTVLIDDRAATIVARERGVKVGGTLGMLCKAISRQALDLDEATRAVDALIDVGGARFPCRGATFRRWALDNEAI